MNARKPEPIAVFVALVHEVLNGERFATIADLVDAVKTRAARCRMRYDSDIVGRAVAQVERLRPIVEDDRRTRRRLAPIVEPHDAPPVSAADAAGILAMLARRLGTPDLNARAIEAPKDREMHDWQRVTRPTKCGACNTPIGVGALVCILSTGDGWKKARCASCAGTPVPDHVEPPPAGDDADDRALRIDRMRLYALRRLTGTAEREPGQEG